MISPSTSTITTSLLLLSTIALGRPHSGSPNAQHIPLAKKANSALTKKDGSLDWGKTYSHLAKTQTKYSKSNLNQEEGALLNQSPKLNKRNTKKPFNPLHVLRVPVPLVPVEVPVVIVKNERRMRLSQRSIETDQVLTDASTMGNAMVVLVNQKYLALTESTSTPATPIVIAPTTTLTPVSSTRSTVVPSISSIVVPVVNATPLYAAATLAQFQQGPPVKSISPLETITLKDTANTPISVTLLSSQIIIPTQSESISISSTRSPTITPTIYLSTLSPTLLPALALPTVLPIPSLADVLSLPYPTDLTTTYRLGALIPTELPFMPLSTTIMTTPEPVVYSTHTDSWPPHISPTTILTGVPTPTATPSTGSQSLTNFGAGSVWAGYIEIGTPPVKFLMDMDTGSSDLWIPSISCTSQACNGRASYDPSLSTTSYLLKGQELNILYGDGSTTSGPVYTDTINFAGLTAYNQTFGTATSLSDDWSDDPMDGLLGMAYQTVSQLKTSPIFQTLMTENAVIAPQFSFHLALNNSELFLGGMNSNLFLAGSTLWYPVSTQSYWIIPGETFIGNLKVENLNGGNGGELNFIVDTGTSVIVAPTADAETYWASIPTGEPYENGYYTYDCATPPTLSFSFGSASQTHQWTVSSDTFNLGQVEPGSTRCVGAIIGADIGVSAWVLGDAFLENVYSTFDFGTNSVGFSALLS